MGTMASQITSLTIIYSIIYSGVDQRKHQSSASLAFMQMASNAENVSIWWRHHGIVMLGYIPILTGHPAKSPTGWVLLCLGTYILQDNFIIVPILCAS